MVLESAVTGEQLLVLEVAEGETCEDMKRAVGWRLNHPTFAIHVINASGTEVAGLATWASIGCPSVLGILLRPRTTFYTAALVHSVLEGDADGVKKVLEAGQEPDSWIKIPGRFKEPALHSAIAYDRQDCVKVLLQGFASPSIVGWNRRSALHLAALKSKPEVVNLLILCEADINAHDTFGQTPLHVAAYANCVETVRCLLAAGADALASDMDGETPLEPGMNSDARCDLMNSCWHRLRPVDVFQLALLDVCNMLSGMRLTQLRQLCRPVRRQLQFYYGGHTDVQGGSAAHLDMGCFAAEVEQCNETSSKKRKVQAVQAPVEHNRIVATILRDFRRNGKLLAPVTSSLNLLDCTSLQSVSLQPLLPCQVRSGYIQRSIMPTKPTCWPAASPDVIDHLRLVNAHPLDQHLSFEALSHTYFWHGCRVSISATGLIHRFSHGFDPAQALALMRNGNQWPRPKYLRSSIPASLWSKLRTLDYASELLSMLAATPPPAEDICKLVRHCIAEHPQDKDLLLSVAKSDSEILQQWKHAAEVGASQGTWMHTSFECLLNGGFVRTYDHEMALCVLFLRAVMDMGAVIYRTEWMIYAEVEDLAGSIDLVLKLPNSKLILVDWKRTQNIQSKCQSFGRNMLGCLQDIPDCTLWHYRLQLNVYRHILQNYYTQEVSMMFIVGCHPDNGESPFVENVCLMEEQTIALMKTLEGRGIGQDSRGGGACERASTVNPSQTSPLPLCLLGLTSGGWKPETAADAVLIQSIFCKPFLKPQNYERIWVQLDEFYRTTSPFSHTLAKFPSLFWILPAPFDTAVSRIEWRYKLEVARIFLHLVKDGKVIELESAMIAFFWPEIQSNPSLLDVVSTAKSSSSRRDRIKQLVFALLCFHVLSLPSLQMLQMGSACLMSCQPKRMPTFIFYRYVVLYQALAAHVWPGRKGQSRKDKVLGVQYASNRDDRRGGASDEESFQARVDAEFEDQASALNQPRSQDGVEPAAIGATQAKEEPLDDAEPDIGDEVPESTWKVLKKRRLLPGALTSFDDFANLFQSLADVNDEFQGQPAEPVSNFDTILHVVQKYQDDIGALYPRFSKHMVRLATAARAIFCLRLADMSIREHALMLWIIEGSDFLRFHEGDCYMLHPCGAFQRYKGVPPDSSRISSFLLELEGMFRRFPEDSPRDHERLLQVINQQWQEAGENEELLKQRCIKAAVSNVGESLVKQRGGDDADMDGDVKNWRVYAARVVLQLKVRLARELTEEKLLHYMVEWCETPKRTASACCFEDCCVEYCDAGVARQAWLL